MNLQKKYKRLLIVIFIMLICLITIGTGYGLWTATKSKNEKSSITLDCFKVYYSGEETISLKNIRPVINEEGIESSPYTLTITNTCENPKELQVRLNILKDTTVNLNSLTIQAAGNIEQDTTLYKNLTNVKTADEETIQSKMIGLITINPNETVRTNIKLWFDEKKVNSISREDLFKARFELIDSELAIKPTLSEMLLNNAQSINNKKTPDYSSISTTEEDLYSIDTDEGKKYYYRGIVNNNYLKFGNYIWRIVGLNADNSIKIILDKPISNERYSEYVNAPDYTGFKYIYNGATVNNSINDILTNWYLENYNNDLDKYVVSANYCNDASYTIKNYHTYFNGYERIINSSNPTMNCPKPTSDFGGIYNQKIGLITADEIMFAGGNYGTDNTSYYLANGEAFYTGTPSEYYNYKASVFYVSSTGSLETITPNEYLGIRPVISLKSDIIVSGTGTHDDPFTIDNEVLCQIVLVDNKI